MRSEISQPPGEAGDSGREQEDPPRLLRAEWDACDIDITGGSGGVEEERGRRMVRGRRESDLLHNQVVLVCGRRVLLGGQNDEHSGQHTVGNAQQYVQLGRFVM